MERSKEQKILNVFAIIELIAGIINIVMAVLLMLGGGAALGNVNSIVQNSNAVASDISNLGITLLGVGIGTVLIGLFQLYNWSLMKKVVNDGTQYKKAWIVTLVLLALAVINIITSLFMNANASLSTGIASLLINGCIFYLINKIKHDSLA
ncbi:MAG: hypothetical protein IJ875_01240 [Solobacterium sp.]|nr:hypothetical protein [Solobacterium sp.]